MRTPEDLHPDDRVARDRLARQLQRIRERKSITGPALSAVLGKAKTYVWLLERQSTWEVRTVQPWARSLDRRLALAIEGLEIPDDGDPMAAIYAAQRPTSVEAEDRLDLRILVNDLRRIRIDLGLTQPDLAARLGCTFSSVSRRESQPDGSMLITVQRYARALGGRLQVGVA